METNKQNTKPQIKITRNKTSSPSSPGTLCALLGPPTAHLFSSHTCIWKTLVLGHLSYCHPNHPRATVKGLLPITNPGAICPSSWWLSCFVLSCFWTLPWPASDRSPLSCPPDSETLRSCWTPASQSSSAAHSTSHFTPSPGPCVPRSQSTTTWDVSPVTIYSLDITSELQSEYPTPPGSTTETSH